MTGQPGRTDDRARGHELPARDQLSLVNANISVPVNTAVTTNVQSDGSIAAPRRADRPQS